MTTVHKKVKRKKVECFRVRKLQLVSAWLKNYTDPIIGVDRRENRH